MYVCVYVVTIALILQRDKDKVCVEKKNTVTSLLMSMVMLSEGH